MNHLNVSFGGYCYDLELNDSEKSFIFNIDTNKKFERIEGEEGEWKYYVNNTSAFRGGPFSVEFTLEGNFNTEQKCRSD